MEKDFSLAPQERVLLPQNIKADIASYVSLPANKQEEIIRLPLEITRIAVSSTDEIEALGQCLEAMNTYGTDDAVESIDAEEKSEYYQHLLSPAYLKADGLIMSLGGHDVAYACFYPVQAEYELETGTMRQDLLQYYQDCHKRADWMSVAQYLCTVLQDEEPVEYERLYHLYDYATPSVADRGKGFGRFILRLASDTLLPENAIRVGFIDPEHGDSLLASCQSGSVLGRECAISPDGEHPSFFSFYSANFQKSFNESARDSVLMSAEAARHNLKGFIEVLREAVSDGQTLVAFNPHRQNYERVVVRSKSVIK